MITAIVNTCNEERVLERCLSHLRWADELVVVDMHSTDNSVAIARRFTDKIFEHERTISVLYARNFSLTKVTGDWILIVDPDEVIPETLAQELKRIAASGPEYSAVSIPQRMFFLGKQLRYAYPVIWKTRFFKKQAAAFPERVHSEPKISGAIHFLPEKDEFVFDHYVADSVASYIEKMNRYTSDEARHMHEDDGLRFRLFNLFKKPLAEFYYRYIRRRGYNDGMHGFIFSVLMAVYRLVTVIKLWEEGRRVRS